MFNATRIGELVECPWCEESFQRRQHAQIYCTRNCKDSAKLFRRKYGPDAKRPPARPCENCGGPLPVRRDSVRFCGKPECRSVSKRDTWQNSAERCTEPGCDRPVIGRGLCPTHYSYWWQENNGDRHTYSCHECGKEFSQPTKARHDKQFCSAECHGAYVVSLPGHREKMTAGHREYIASRVKVRECAWCSDELETLKSGQKYCDKACKDAAALDRARRKNPIRRAYVNEDWGGFIRAVRNESTVIPSGCWEWMKLKGGYPEIRFGVDGSFALHRVMLEAKMGAPLGSQAAHHMCANPKCVNPDHLQPVTHRENIAEMLARHSYLDRITELESALSELEPKHPLLNMIPVK